jgi:hypothetical protein
MRRSFSIIVAAVMAVTGAVASFAPAQAATARVAPAVATQAAADTGIVKILDERRRWRGDRHYRRHYGNYYEPRRYYRYPRYYRHYGYYQPRRYYRPYGHHYRSRPHFSFGFSF